MSVFEYVDRGFPVLFVMGEYQRNELHVTLERAFDRMRARPAPGFLIDVSESAAIRRRSAAEVCDTFRFIGSNRQLFGGRLALVATSDLGFGLMRMGLARAFEYGLDGQAFRDYDKAMAWLSAAAQVRAELGQTG
ncbi:MAG: hypothetical protein JWN53_16 [Gemmatimonadetes bacterium]|nr:hypothetical protein [Gemmatimonadota bacterium]